MNDRWYAEARVLALWSLFLGLLIIWWMVGMLYPVYDLTLMAGSWLMITILFLVGTVYVAGAVRVFRDGARIGMQAMMIANLVLLLWVWYVFRSWGPTTTNQFIEELICYAPLLAITLLSWHIQRKRLATDFSPMVVGNIVIKKK